MATFRHPVTGVELNRSDILRPGRLSDEEKSTGQILQREGHPRWLAAQMLGTHSLAFPSIGRRPEPRRKATGRHLSRDAAAEDPRQDDMGALIEMPEHRRPAKG